MCTIAGVYLYLIVRVKGKKERKSDSEGGFGIGRHHW
jgi:hypothetical protein